MKTLTTRLWEIANFTNLKFLIKIAIGYVKKRCGKDLCDMDFRNKFN
jgi:hypothetical protein